MAAITLERHLAGVARLNAIFGWTEEDAARLRREKKAALPNAERAFLRRRGKAQRLARRRNR